MIESKNGTFIPQAGDLARVSEAIEQNPGYKVVYEFPNNESRNAARRILRELQIRALRYFVWVNSVTPTEKALP
ncbi:MAG: hypothetical protein OEM02_14580 [Desulfobulbaceae bacterium]|nr:hypothetical protein [Desulfobulbaceae bacterium]